MRPELRSMLEDSREDIGHFLGLGSEKKWYGTYSDKPDGDWDKTAEDRMLNVVESGHPVFRATSALEREELRSKEKGNESIHINGSEETTELILRTIISVNQLSVYGTVADLENWPETQKVRGNQPKMRICNQRWYRQNFLM